MDDIPLTQVLEQPPPTPGYQSQPPSRPLIPSGPSKLAKTGPSFGMLDLGPKIVGKYRELIPLLNSGIQYSNDMEDYKYFSSIFKQIKTHFDNYIVAGGRRRKTRRHHKKRKL